MNWPSLFLSHTLAVIRTLWIGPLLWLPLLLPMMPMMPLQAHAQGIESVLAPGKVITAHVKLENDCKQCHIKFDRKAQSGLCAGCHKDVAADMTAKTGFHGVQKPQPCNVCHTDHKGRKAQIIELDTNKFNHAQTDFVLKGKHVRQECSKCHASDKKYREAPLTCVGCHRKDDTHKASLGTKCADCHHEDTWKEIKFDHDSTHFALLGKHFEAKCASCHKGGIYKDTPRACVSCHKKDDESAKGHKGQFGDKCETCHGVKDWKPSTFNHDVDTPYDLHGKHRTASCAACHKEPLYRVKLGTDCYACHQKDDKHKDSLGRDCASCHSERSWKEPARFDHDKSSFPLVGKHLKIDCKNCHKSVLFNDAPKDCVGCHQKDDKHNNTLGNVCSTCHGDNDWKTTTGRFVHDETRFVVRNGHLQSKVKCINCHKDLQSFRNTPLACFACHQKDDKHDGQSGKACETCHNDGSWRVGQFDHGLTRLALTGRHILTPCKSCHATLRYKDAPRDCYSCHQKEDRHKQKLGERCENCHNTRSWKLWDFDHDKRGKYVLDGAHQKVPCESCHRLPAPKGRDADPLAANCIACHAGADVHDGQFGVRCEQCHTTENWKKFQHRSGFGLEPTKPVQPTQPTPPKLP